MKAARLAAAVAIPLLAVAAEPVVVQGADLELLAEVKAIASRTARLLGLREAGSPAAVRADAPTRRAVLEAAITSDAERLRGRGRAWADLGFGDPDLPARFRRVVADDLEGACLDAEGGRLLVDPTRLSEADFASTPAGGSAASLLLVAGVRPDEPLLAHYVEHARARWTAARFPETTDAWLAAAAWAEGRANLAALSLLFEGVGVAESVAEGRIAPSSVLDGALVPPTLRSGTPVERSLLFFIYEEGFAQAAAALKAGGSERVLSEAGARRTTRDVLHPDRPPFRGDLPEPPAPAAGYRVADRDVLGEQAIVTLVSVLTGKDNLGLLAGDGWAGDALVRFEPVSGGGAGYTHWTVRSTDDGRAGDLAYGLLRGLETLHAGRVWEGSGEARVLRTHDRVVRFRRTGNVIELRIAPPAIDAAMEKSPTESASPRAPKPRN